MLSSLVAYYEQLLEKHPDVVAPIDWVSDNISFIAHINERGELTGLVRNDKEFMTRIVPSQETKIAGTSNVEAKFLYGKSSYILGLNPNGKSERNEQCFEAARELHHQVLDSVSTLTARAILSYFDMAHPLMDNPVIASCDDKVFSGVNIAFCVHANGLLLDPLEDDEIKKAWKRYVDSRDAFSVMCCLVTGRLDAVARLHPRIKGVEGARSSGAFLVSFNERAFESYGHKEEQGRNAPVSEYAAQAYAAALNYLLVTPEHHTQLGDTTVVYWSDRKDDQNTQMFACLMGAAIMDDVTPKEDTDKIVDATMKSIARGSYRDLSDVDLDATFHLLGLAAPSGSRLLVKFYYKDSFGEMLGNLAKHYRRSDIVHSGPSERAYLTPFQLLKDIERHQSEKSKSRESKTEKHVMASILGGPLLRSMLEDTPYPQALYSNALLRIHATQEDPDNHVRKVTRARASIIRAYLIKNCARKGYDEKGLTVGLNENRNETAYCLGRAFAILEDIQKIANEEVTITNRYFNAASTTPLTVFPSIIRLSNAHLTKIGRKKPAFASYLKQSLCAVLGEERVAVFPKRLSLEEQGDFMLGYIHQRNTRDKGKNASDNNVFINNEEE